MNSRLPVLFVVLVFLSWFNAANLAALDEGTRVRQHLNLPLTAVSGPQRTLVILVQFPDKANSSSPTQLSSLLSGMNDYYRENSYGLVSFLTDFAPSPASWGYQMPNSMAYYGADTTARDNELVHDSLQAAYNSGVSLGNYKFAIVIHAGNDEAITRTSIDIHSYTIPGYPFRPAPLTTYTISTSVVSESDPMGVYSHESGHLLGLPDLYDVTGQIDPVNNFIGYWEIMALGEWNPNTGNPLTRPGTYPAHMSAWSKIQLGFVLSTEVATVQPGESSNITIENLEQPTSGTKAVRIPIAYNFDGTLTYYLLEMRAKLGTYDQYLPFPSTYPGAGLLIYKVNESIPNGSGSVRLIDAHPGGDLNDAPFGPCSAPCTSMNIFSDQGNYVKVIITTTSSTAYAVTVDRTSSPVLLLQVNAPAAGVFVSVDGVNRTTDGSKQLRLTVRYGPHTVFIQSSIPISIGSTSVDIGLANRFSMWDDGGTTNPRGISVVGDTILTAVYRIAVEPSFATAAVAFLILVVVVAGVSLQRRKNRKIASSISITHGLAAPASPKPPMPADGTSLPGNDGLPRDPVKEQEQTEPSKS